MREVMMMVLVGDNNENDKALTFMPCLMAI